MVLALRDTQWHALLVISPLVVAALGAYGYVLVRGARAVWRNEPSWAADQFDELCASIFVASVGMGLIVLVVAWVTYAVYLWTLER